MKSLITFISLAFIAVAPGTLSAQISKGDSVLAHEFIREVLEDILSADFDTLREDQIDSLLLAERVWLGHFKIHYSPDSLFKIIVAEGESCGAYCNPFWKSQFILNRTHQKFNELNLKEVSSIEKLPDSKYLILQSFSGRSSSPIAETGYAATVVSLTDSSIIVHPIPYNHPKWGTNLNEYDDGSFVFSQEHIVPSEIWIEYDSETLELSYKYGTFLGDCCDSAYTFTGSFRYVDGTFIHQQECKQYIRPEEIMWD